MIHEAKTHIDITILMLPVIAHFALLIGCSMWGFIDDSDNKYAKWVYEKLDGKEVTCWHFTSTIGFSAASFVMACVYGLLGASLRSIHPLAPYFLAGAIALLFMARGTRRVQKVLTEHINDKKLHKEAE